MRTKLIKVHTVKSHLIVQFDKFNGHDSGRPRGGHRGHGPPLAMILCYLPNLTLTIKFCTTWHNIKNPPLVNLGESVFCWVSIKMSSIGCSLFIIFKFGLSFKVQGINKQDSREVISQSTPIWGPFGCYSCTYTSVNGKLKSTGLTVSYWMWKI